MDWLSIITQDTWPVFYKLWKNELPFMSGDYYKCKHLLYHVGPAEKIMFQNFEDPAKIIAGLMQIFGTEADQVSRRIEELKNFKKPKQEEHQLVQKNLMKFRQHLLFIIEIGEQTRLESGVMREIIPKAFSTQMYDDLHDLQSWL